MIEWQIKSQKQFGPNKRSKEATNTVLSNGLDFLPDGKTFYFVDSKTGKVDAFDLDVDTGELSNRRVVFDFEANGLEGPPDGIAVDERNPIWIACVGPGLLAEVKPDLNGGQGQLLGAIEFPESKSITAVELERPVRDHGQDIRRREPERRQLVRRAQREEPLRRRQGQGVAGQGSGCQSCAWKEKSNQRMVLLFSKPLNGNNEV